MLTSLLVANRGEIARRIIRACRELGIRSVAAHSDADRDSPFVVAADDAVRLGPASARESYLDIDAIIRAAHDTGVEGVHPGYGFLAERADFAAAVTAAGLVFVGPSPEAMAELGDKRSARAVARRVGLPVLEGHALGPAAGDLTARGETTRDAGVALDDALAHVGLPVVVKAAFGGGGRGMRVVRDRAELAGAITSAARESKLAFGRDELYLERFLERPRHVEVQVIFDAHGNSVHLGTRDCTTQRRHQKLIEEAPAVGVADDIIAAMVDGARRLCREVGYVGVATVEYLVEPATAEWFFLEANARLQVEHTVTELVFGVDLVVAQLRVASGEALRFTQDEIAPRGHAVQARVNAEDPSAGFTPVTGTVDAMEWPMGPWVRCDTGIQVGSIVTAHYDSLLGKVIAWGPDRATATTRLVAALREVSIVGVTNTALYLAHVLEHPAHRAFSHWTGFVDTAPIDLATLSADLVRSTPSPPRSPEAPAFAGATTRLRFDSSGGLVDIVVPIAAGAAARSLGGDEDVSLSGFDAGGLRDGCVAPMDCVLLMHTVSTGDRIIAGTTVAVVESMKMETSVVSDRDGVVSALHGQTGSSFRRGDVIVTVIAVVEAEAP